MFHVATPRSELGISLDDAARVVGVGRGTLTRYEINPAAVGDARRRLIEGFYRDLQRTIERARARQPKEG